VRKLTDISERLKSEIKKREQAERTLKERLLFEELLSSISARFINVPFERIDEEIHNAMQNVLKFFKVDRFALLETFPDKESWIITHSASITGVPSVPVGLELPISINPWAYEKLVTKGEVLSLSNIDDAPDEANQDKKTWIGWGIRSNLNIPIKIQEHINHIIAINSVMHERVWSEEFISRLRLLGEIFINALERRQDRLRLEEQLRFEMLLSDISSHFVNLSVDQIDSEIEDAQRRICECLGLHLSVLWQWSAEIPHSFTMTHFYRPLGGPPPPEPMYSHEYFPWCQEQVEAGKIIVVSSLDDLPAEAARDREVWRHFGIKNALTFPLVPGGGRPIGALCFNDMLAERTWQEPLIKLLQLIAQIFTNALVRKQNETALRESESRLSLATEIVGAGLWIMEVDTKKVWVSPKSRDLFHFAPDEEITYESYFKVIHPDDRERVHQDVQHAIQSGESLHCDYRIVLPDGSIRWIVARGQHFLKSTGEPDRLMGLSLDITERKQMELQLSESQTLLSSLVNSTSDMIWSVDAEHFGLLTFNRGLYEYFCHHRDIHIEAGMRPEDLFPDEKYIQRWRAFYQQALDEGSFTTEYLVYAGIRTLRLNLNILKNDERVFGISVFGQDITKLKRMENQLREQLAEIEKLKSQLEKENIYLREEIKTELGFGKIIGNSNALQYVLFRAHQVASTDATVLILGETGVGKGMVAHAIHEMSARKDKPMITVNCAALPANLIESELFGREKGAFTGAHTRQMGRFEIADGGTIFLDEIGDLPLELQSKLLRVVQDGEFERLGSPRTIKVDVRVIASTSRDLKAEMCNGRFREDLYYRLNVFPVSLPPLRMRVGDIPELAKYFIDKYARKHKRRFETISKDVMQVLQAYHWPGNVRELEHVIERAAITSPGPVFQLYDQFESEPVKAGGGTHKEFDAMARDHILDVLQKTRWKISGEGGAAAILGLKPSTLRFRIKKLGITRP
jgi:formate hydrogenlyase transcriptional activator